jgi:hypothetical protein
MGRYDIFFQKLTQKHSETSTSSGDYCSLPVADFRRVTPGAHGPPRRAGGAGGRGRQSCWRCRTRCRICRSRIFLRKKLKLIIFQQN